MFARVRRTELITFAELQQCFDVQGTLDFPGGVPYCTSSIPINETTLWDIPDFNIYRLTSAGVAPDFTIPPGIFETDEYPNQDGGIRAVAASLDCRGLPQSSPFRWVWEVPLNGPCYFDTEYGLELCSPGGIIDNNANYQNPSGGVMPNGAVFQNVFCPSSL